jgi:hypothetical protein
MILAFNEIGLTGLVLSKLIFIEINGVAYGLLSHPSKH